MKKLSITPGIKMTLLIVCLLSLNKGFAQPNPSFIADKAMKPASLQEEKKKLPLKIGFGIEAYASGNAHGAFYSAGINLAKGKSIFSLSPCIQKRTFEVNGIKAGYSYLLSGINDRYDEDELNEIKEDPRDILELRLLCYVQYLHQSRLSYKASRVETVTGNESNVNFNEVRLSTAEAALCAELDINIKWFKIRTYMGATVFYHTNYINGMYRAKCSPALIFGAGIIIPSI